MTPKDSYVLWLLSGKTLCVHCSIRPVEKFNYMHCNQCDRKHNDCKEGCQYIGEIEAYRRG